MQLTRYPILKILVNKSKRDYQQHCTVHNIQKTADKYANIST